MRSASSRTMIGAAIGNALEMYDYVIWGLFSVFLSKEFLPPNSELSDIFFLFLITYILRPIGSLVSGILADQVGRKKMLTFSIILMGACTSIVGILPSYTQIGVISVFLLLFIRLIQVLAIGSEYISSIALLIESGDKHKRGYLGSWAAFGINAGVLISSLFGSFILYLLDLKMLPEWGWRFVFILAFITMLIGYWIRNSLPESIEFINKNARSQTRTFLEILYEAITVFKSQSFDVILVFFLVCFGVSTTVLIFIAPLHITTVNHIHNTQSFLINSLSLGLLVLLIPLFGFLSDLYGRVKTLMAGSITLLLLILPYFQILSSGDFYQILLAHIIMAIPCANIFAVTPILITEIFPLSIRCSVTNFIYSLASSIGGGITPLIAFKLIHYANYFPGLILLVLGLINVVFLWVYMGRISSFVPKLLLVEK